MNEVVITEARPDEADEIARSYEWLFTPPGIRPANWSHDRAVAAIKRAVASESSVILIARLQAELVGFCSAYDELESVRFGRRVWVEDLAVHPGHRSLRVGKQLLDEAKRWALSRGAARLQLESGEARADAHRFYEREQPSSRAIAFAWELH
jgi:GNAT superfamily N-acetyltransferase